jgi:hypothetical protein
MKEIAVQTGISAETLLNLRVKDKISTSPIIFLPFRTGGNLKIQNAVSKKCKEIIAQVLRRKNEQTEVSCLIRKADNYVTPCYCR